MTKSLQQQLDSLAGQLAALGIAIHTLIRAHPQCDQVSAAIHEGLEQILSRALSSALSDEFELAIQQARDLYLVTNRDDPGQPRLP